MVSSLEIPCGDQLHLLWRMENITPVVRNIPNSSFNRCVRARARACHKTGCTNCRLEKSLPRLYRSTGFGNKACTWLGELAICSCITLMHDHTSVLISYVLHALFPSPVKRRLFMHFLCERARNVFKFGFSFLFSVLARLKSLPLMARIQTFSPKVALCDWHSLFLFHSRSGCPLC